MRILSGWTRVVAVGLVGISLSAGVGRTQKPGAGQVPTAGTPDPFGANTDSKAKDDQSPFGSSEAKQAKLRNEDRQRRLVADTDKLLQLATQLHNDVGKTDQHILSLDVVRRADEIEKLAHSVKERMKD